MGFPTLKKHGFDEMSKNATTLNCHDVQYLSPCFLLVSTKQQHQKDRCRHHMALKYLWPVHLTQRWKFVNSNNEHEPPCCTQLLRDFTWKLRISFGRVSKIAILHNRENFASHKHFGGIVKKRLKWINPLKQWQGCQATGTVIGANHWKVKSHSFSKHAALFHPNSMKLLLS